MTHQSETDAEPAGDAGSRARPRLTPKKLGIASGISAAAAVAVLAVATTVAVQAANDEDPSSSDPVTIAGDSTAEDAPEKAEVVEAPVQTAAAYDQLSVDEVAYARFLVSQTDEYADGADLFGDAGLQFLSADVADPSFYSDGHRRMSLLYYDYAADRLLIFILNLTTGEVESAEGSQGAQPAPSEAETMRGWELLLNDAEAGADLSAQYAELGGGALTVDSADLEITAHSFTTDTATFGAETCGVDRCLQMLAQVDGGTFLVTLPYVVNLSTSSVLPVT